MPVSHEDAALHSTAAQVFEDLDPLGRRRGKDGTPAMSVRARQRREQLAHIESQMELLRLPPATIINLNPYPLEPNGPLVAKYVIQACPADKEYHRAVISRWEVDWRDTGDENFVPSIVLPIELARDIHQQFEKFGGVVVCQGDVDPADPNTDPAILRNLEAAREKMLGRLRVVFGQAQSEYASPGRAGWKNITDFHRAAAIYLYQHGYLDHKPEWVHMTKVEAQIDKPCPFCQATDNKKGAVACKHCSYVLDPLAALELGEITEEHHSLRRLTREQLDAAGLTFIKTNDELRASMRNRSAATEETATESPKPKGQRNLK